MENALIKNLYRRFIPLAIRQSVIVIKTIPARVIILVMVKFFNRRRLTEDKIITVIRLDGIGDFIVWLNAAKELKELYKEYKVDLICSTTCAPIASSTGYFDRIISVPMNNLRVAHICSLFRLRKTLANIFCMKLIQFTPYSNPFADYVASCVFSTCKITTSYDLTTAPNEHGVHFSKCIYDKILETPTKALHELERNAYFLNKLGHSYISSVQKLPEYDKPKLSKMFYDDDYFVVFPGCSEVNRRWDFKKFYQVIKYIYAKTHIKCCICGGAEDRDAANDLMVLIAKGNIECISLCGETDLKGLSYIIHHSRFLLSNDTSAVHIAVGNNTPVICIYGPWEPRRFYPYHAASIDNVDVPLLCCAEMVCSGCQMKTITLKCQENIIKNNRRLCIEKITVQEVIKQVDILLQMI